MKTLWIGISAALLVLFTTPTLADQALAQQNGCLECHGLDQKNIGPAFHDIASRYKNDASARSALILKVKNGGKGNWTEITAGVPMPPFSPRISDAEIATLVDWVLSQ